MPPKKKTQSTKKPKSGEDASDDEFGVYAVDEDDVVDEKSDDDDDDISDDGNSDLDTSSVVDEPHDEDEADIEDEDIESETGDNSDSEGREDEEAEEEEGDGVHRVKSVHIDDDDDNLDEEDNVDEEEDEYYQKLRGQSRLIQDKYHPELATHSIDEIRVLSIVVRDKKGAIIDANHRTLPFLTKYEKARILGERTQQLDKGAPTFLTVLDPKIIKSYIIASMELEERKLPFIIQRPLPNGKCEFWPLNELEDL